MTLRHLIGFLCALLLSDLAFSNVVGVDTQNFNPTTDGLDFVTVQSSETLKPGVINIGLFLNYAVNTLPYFEANPDNRSSFNDSLLSSDLNLGVGLGPNWDAGISFPAVLSQWVQNTSAANGNFGQTGSTEIRPNTKFRVIGDDSQGIAFIASVDFNRIQNNPYSGIGGGPTYNLELAADTTLGAFAVGANIGHRWRNPGQPIPGSLIQPFKNQIIYSVGANYLIPHWDTKAIAEIFGGTPTDTSSTDTARSQTSLEAILGIKHDFTQNLAFHAGFGTEINHATASPDWRVYTGLNWTFGPLWASNQGLEREQVTPQAESFVAHNILFEFNSDNLAGDYQKTLDELVAYLKKPPQFKKLTIEGHTDSVGSEQYNMKLSQRRADAIKNYMVRHYQIPATQIEAIGYGPTRPIADNGNYQGRQANRRVEFKIER